MRPRGTFLMPLCVWLCTLATLGIVPATAQAAEISLNLKVERKPTVLFRGEPRPVSAFIAAMAVKTVGRTDFTLGVRPRPLYEIAAERDSGGRYRVDPSSLKLSTSATVSARIQIRYPNLSDAQFRALRNTHDYRLLYGLIRGIVEHEELHAKEFVRYARSVRVVYAAPPLTNTDPVIEPTDDIPATLARYVEDRTREAIEKIQRASNARQRAIDHTGKTIRVVFSFADPLEDEVPPPITYVTEGKLRVKFEVVKGNPRPPEPRTSYPADKEKKKP